MKTALHPRQIAIRDYDYPLPDDRIARYPLAERDRSKLLVWRDGAVGERRFYDLPGLVPAGSLMVFNNTRVIQARLHFRKASGALIEVFCLEPDAPRDYAQNFAQTAECTWTCLVGNSKKWKDGELQQDVEVDGRRVALRCERVEGAGASQRIRFRWDGGVAFARILEAVGELPIPPYLGRGTEESDKTTYQTVYSRIEGSVAAPTAGLHFTEAELSALRDKGVALRYLTLHVGAGTFKPVKSETIEGHDMHTEFIAVPRAVVADILALLRRADAPEGRTDADRPRLVAVGTTSVRTVESLYYIGLRILDARAAGRPAPEPDDLVVGQWEPYDCPATTPTADALQAILDHLDATRQDTLVTATQILIAPGFRYRLVEAMVTNFHMPQSTLLLLVSAFVGDDADGAPAWRRIYAHALGHGFRFLSYGDSSLLFRAD